MVSIFQLNMFRFVTFSPVALGYTYTKNDQARKILSRISQVFTFLEEGF